MAAVKPNTVASENRGMARFNRDLLHPRYWTTWLALLFFYFFSMLPLRVISKVGQRLGDYAARRNEKRFNIAKVNLSLCFPDKSEDEIVSMVRGHFRSHIRSLMQYGVIWWASKSRLNKYIEVEGFEQIDDYLEQKRNIILLTCHTAGLEFTGVALAMRYRCSGPYKPMRNAVINWIVTRGRTRLGTIAYTRDQGFRPLIRDTRKGRLLIYLADEDLGSEASVFVPFFGVQKATISVLGRLAKSCDAVVLPCVGCFDEARSKYVIKALAPMQDFPGGSDAADTAAMNQVVENMVLQCPMQYYWSLRLFQTRPPGEDSVYD